MRPLYLFLFMLLLCGTATAQKRSKVDQQITSRYYNGTLFAKVNFASLFDVEAPTLQTGVEYRFSKRLGGEFSIGIPVKSFKESRPTDTTYYNYFKLKAELRFIPGNNRFFYIGPEVFFTKKKQSKYNDFVRANDGDYNYTFAKLNKTIGGLMIKVGRIFPLGERLNFDGSVGLGMRVVNLKIDATNLVRNNSPIAILFHWTPDRQGTIVSPHVAVGLKLSYSIF